MDFEQDISTTEAKKEPKLELEITIDNRVGIPEKQVQAAIIATQFIAGKLLESDQIQEPLKIIFADRIMDGDTPLDHHGEAFPDGRQIAFAMNAPNMKTWQRKIGEIGAMLLLSAHEATHIAQIRKGDPPPNSHDLMSREGIKIYEDDLHEIEAWYEALDLFKALRPHARGQLTIGSKKYKIPNKSTYHVNRSSLPSYIRE